MNKNKPKVVSVKKYGTPTEELIKQRDETKNPVTKSTLDDIIKKRMEQEENETST